MERRVGSGVIALALGDITTIAADAIGNAANAALAGGGGVDGAIHRAGGPAIMAELRREHPDGTPTGTAVVTGAGGLPARWVIHAVGPVWRGGRHGERRLLAAAYQSAMDAAAAAGARTLTLPAISAGIYGYPLGEAAEVAVAAVAERLRAGSPIERATIVLFGPDTYAAFERALSRLP